MGKSKKPKSTKITRNGSKFTFSWSNPQKYKDVDLKYGWNGKNRKSYECGGKAKAFSSATFTINAATTDVRFSVRGQKKGSSESKWDSEVYSIGYPAKPSVLVSDFDASNENYFKYSWSIANADKAHNSWFLYYEYKVTGTYEGESEIVTKDWTKGADLAAEGYWDKIETDISKGSFRRKVYVRSKGKRGTNRGGDATCEHVFGIPLLPTDVTVQSASIDPNNRNINLRVTWTENASYWHPIDTTEFIYAISPPGAGMQAPINLSGDPTTKLKSGNSQFTNGVSKEIPRQMEPNQCLFFQIKHTRDNNSKESSWYRVYDLDTKLASPSQLESIELMDGYWEVSATNNSTDIPDSFMAVSYRSMTNGVSTEPRVIGIIPNGGASVDVKLPEPPETLPNVRAFGIQTIAYPTIDYRRTTVTEATFDSLKSVLYLKTGETYTKVEDNDKFIANGAYYTRYPVYYEIDANADNFELLRSDLYTKSGDVYTKVSPSESYISGTTYYAKFQITVQTVGDYMFKEYSFPDFEEVHAMSSDEIWELGEVPQPPTKFEVVTKTTESALVSWDWNWSGAQYIEISWSTYPDAWESTLDLSSCRVRKRQAKSWTIYGLESGQVYYFKAKFIKVIEDTETEGPWSEVSTLNLTSAPIAPVLELSKSVLTHNQDFLASWTYTSTDGTIQDSAEIFLVTSDTNGTRRGQYRKATEFNPSTVYYTLENDVYTPVVSPIEEDLHLYYIFDDQTALAETPPNSTQQQLELNTADLGLISGNTYYISLRVTSKSGVKSEWSPMVQIRIVEPLDPPIIPTIAQFMPEEVTDTVYDDEGEEVEEVQRVRFTLKALPITLNITGAGESGTTIVAIERTANFFAEKPDDSIDKGYEGETVALIRQPGEAPITITKDDLIGSLDDEGVYKLVVTIIDENGQTATSEHVSATDLTESKFNANKDILFTRTEERPYIYTLVDPEATFDDTESYYFKNEFTVAWRHQPTQFNSDGGPIASVEVDNEHYGVKITTTVPESYEEGDVVDIYRLSVDKPELIVEDGNFGETYVDPYPAIGEFGGHRVVYKTINGDYMTEDRYTSWVDLGVDEGDIIETPYTIINFDDGPAEILFNIDLSNAWKKDFKETRYLGGHIQGDWNPGVSRTGSVSTVLVTTRNQETIRIMRRLADYAGITHIRTRDGSSYAANIDVSENRSYNNDELSNYSLNITRVDSESLDGMTLDDWNRIIETEDEEEGE